MRKLNPMFRVGIIKKNQIAIFDVRRFLFLQMFDVLIKGFSMFADFRGPIKSCADTRFSMLVDQRWSMLVDVQCLSIVLSVDFRSSSMFVFDVRVSVFVQLGFEFWRCSML